MAGPSPGPSPGPPHLTPGTFSSIYLLHLQFLIHATYHHQFTPSYTGAATMHAFPGWEFPATTAFFYPTRGGCFTRCDFSWIHASYFALPLCLPLFHIFLRLPDLQPIVGRWKVSPPPQHAFLAWFILLRLGFLCSVSSSSCPTTYHLDSTCDDLPIP